MANNLLIVESPAKSKTIANFLGKEFKVLSSYGHIRDLKTKGMGIDIPNDFTPQYEIPEEKEKVVQELQKAAKKADKVWLASDEDREGEAIAWHLAEVLGLDKSEKNRIVFHEITKSAIQNALENPRSLDLQMVDAQQARRVLDRIVGFELSPVLWKKIRPSLSAGRVQSVAVRIIVEREREIQAFSSQSSYRVVADFITSKKDSFTAELSKRLASLEEANQFLESLKEACYRVEAVEVKPATKSPAPPFTTSTLQQEASRRLGFSVGETMRLAQNLYEAGAITYMRTDSVNLSTFAIATTCAEVEKEYGQAYVHARNFATKSKGAQEAHEAIRPTHIESEEAGANRKERLLYEMIRKRTLASQMSDANVERTQVSISTGSTDVNFVARGEVITFDGFLRVYMESKDEEENDTSTTGKEGEDILPKFTVTETVIPKQVTAIERFTQRPPRYTEATLVKRLEELGIGRPSTYAPIIQTIQKREYVEKRSVEGSIREYRELKLKSGKISTKVKQESYNADRNKLFPTDIGIIVTDFLSDAFPQILDYNFTAIVEGEFDEIALGKKEWKKVLGSFYDIFSKHVVDILAQTTERKIGEREIGIDPKSGLPVFAKIGRFGPMVQIGESGGDDKPLFSSIPKELSIETITLEQALELFSLPRSLGEYKGMKVDTNIGRFGPYVRYDKKYVSIPKDGPSPYDITLEEAISLIEAKEEVERQKQIAQFGEGDEVLQILSGRFGPYISYKQNNYKIPKSLDPYTLTEEEARALISATPESSDKSKRRTTTSKKRTK